MGQLALQFDPRLIGRLAARFRYDGEARIVDVIGPVARSGAGSRPRSSSSLPIWKSPRPRRHVRANRPAVIEEATRIALSAEAEEIRIGVLLALRGVQWPTAPTVLHLGHRDRYPILDVRALESLGFTQKNASYDFDFWWDYVTTCRRLADEHKVDMRTLDRVLWQWSKERAPTARR